MTRNTSPRLHATTTRLSMAALTATVSLWSAPAAAYDTQLGTVFPGAPQRFAELAALSKNPDSFMGQKCSSKKRVNSIAMYDCGSVTVTISKDGPVRLVRMSDAPQAYSITYVNGKPDTYTATEDIGGGLIANISETKASQQMGVFKQAVFMRMPNAVMYTEEPGIAPTLQCPRGPCPDTPEANALLAAASDFLLAHPGYFPNPPQPAVRRAAPVAATAPSAPAGTAAPAATTAPSYAGTTGRFGSPYLADGSLANWSAQLAGGNVAGQLAGKGTDMLVDKAVDNLASRVPGGALVAGFAKKKAKAATTNAVTNTVTANLRSDHWFASTCELVAHLKSHASRPDFNQALQMVFQAYPVVSNDYNTCLSRNQ